MNFPQDKPIYQLNADCFLDDDTIHREGEQIIYPGVPNEQMVPLNDLARERMRAYLQELDEGARLKAEMMGRRFTGRPTDWQDQVAQTRADAEALKKREMPIVPSEAPSLTGVAGKTLAQRQAHARASGVQAVGSSAKPSGRPEAQPIHRDSGLTQAPPLSGR